MLRIAQIEAGTRRAGFRWTDLTGHCWSSWSNLRRRRRGQVLIGSIEDPFVVWSGTRNYWGSCLPT